MNEIRRDPRRVRMLTTAPINEIGRDPRRDDDPIIKGLAGFPLGKHETCMAIRKLSHMAKVGEIHSARDRIPEIGQNQSHAIYHFASSAVEYSGKIPWEVLFPNIKTCPPKFSLNTTRE